MTAYFFEDGEIIKGQEHVGWIGDGANNRFACLIAIKTILEKHDHTLKVNTYRAGFEVVVPDLFIREVEMGYYITGKEDELNYAFFSKDMNCAKSCVKAVLDVMQK